MSLIQCTQKLLKELKREPYQEKTMPSQLGDWHANLLYLERKKCVLFTQNETLYSFFVPGLKKNDFEHFEECFRQGLFRCLINEEFEQSQIEQILSGYAEIKIAKTSNRSVLGSMNDLVFQLKYRINASGGLNHLNLDLTIQELNRVPMSAIDYHFSIEKLKSRLSQYHD